MPKASSPLRYDRALTLLLVRSLASMLLWLCLCGRMAADEERLPSTTPARTAASDGINSLSIFLRLWGHDADRSALQSALGAGHDRLSLEDLRRASDQSGVETAVYRCQPGQLLASGLPCIVFMESPDSGQGSFAVLVDVNTSKSTCLLLDGGTVSFVEYRVDQFFRRWSGYALMRRTALRRAANRGRVVPSTNGRLGPEMAVTSPSHSSMLSMS
jgi:hypothetical protein